jgi:hypothetical protein
MWPQNKMLIVRIESIDWEPAATASRDAILQTPQKLAVSDVQFLVGFSLV